MSGFEANVLHAAAALHPASVARVIAQDVAHGFRGDGEEVRATLGRRLLLPNDLEIGLVHQRGGVQRDVTVPSATLLPGQAPQLVVDEREQSVQCLNVAAFDSVQQFRDRRVVRGLTHLTALAPRNRACCSFRGSMSR